MRLLYGCTPVGRCFFVLFVCSTRHAGWGEKGRVRFVQALSSNSGTSTSSVTESPQHLSIIMFNPYGVIFHRRSTFRGLRQAQPPMEGKFNDRINEIVRVLNHGRTSRASLHFSTLLCLSSPSLNKRERFCSVKNGSYGVSVKKKNPC